MGMLTGVLDILFPPRCTFCRSLLKRGESGVCSSCEKSLPYSQREQGVEFLEYCTAPLYYEGKVRDALHRYKFKGVTAYSSVFGSYLADCISERKKDEYDMISWVPLSGKRLKQRGYDQAMLLAMAAALKLDDVAVETLKKVRDVAPQSTSDSVDKRRANVSGAYEVADAELIQGKRILLIDDIVTTGSTFSECARVLRMGGAESVGAIALAMAR